MIGIDSKIVAKGLRELPAELLHQTFELLCQHCAEKHLDTPRIEDWDQDQKIKEDRRCLLNLSVTCAKWGYIAQQVLHHHFGFLETRYEQQTSFCRTICGNPELGRQLRVAKFRKPKIFLLTRPAEDWIAEPFTKYSNFISCPTSSIMNCLAWEAYAVPLILLQAPNLEHIALHGLKDWLVFKDFNIRNVTQARALPQNLKSMSLGGQHQMILPEHDEQVMIQDTLMSLLFATFEKLQMLTISKPHLDLLYKPPPLQNLRSLRLFNVAIVEDKLRPLVDGAESLEEFIFWEMSRAELAPLPCVTPDGVFSILSRKSTLKRVIVQMTATPVAFADDQQLIKPETLRDLWLLGNLEELRINSEMLCNIPELMTKKKA
ncbi:hypothetical protein ACHAP5_011252, partial [Fusarium lateritium]